MLCHFSCQLPVRREGSDVVMIHSGTVNCFQLTVVLEFSLGLFYVLRNMCSPQEQLVFYSLLVVFDSLLKLIHY
jgi:hypothetical protein